MAVEVGLVEGTIAATTPNGSAISIRRRSGWRAITPTVAIGRMNACTSRAANRFFSTLSATTP